MISSFRIGVNCNSQKVLIAGSSAGLSTSSSIIALTSAIIFCRFGTSGSARVCLNKSGWTVQIVNSVVCLLLVQNAVVSSLVRDLGSWESGRGGCHHLLITVVFRCPCKAGKSWQCNSPLCGLNCFGWGVTEGNMPERISILTQKINATFNSW